MELAAGGTLRQVLHDRGPRAWLHALERHTQILSALLASHQRGVVHRDLKPGNLMFRRDADAPGAEIMLGDFGVAHLPDSRGATGARAAEARKPAEAQGTLAYMSPEQRRGADADPRSDLYSAAVVLFEMLTGAPPWSRDVLLAGTRRRGDFHLPESGIHDASAALVHSLQEHLDRLGDPEPENRPDTAQALAEARALRDLALVEAAPG
jgi:serine/threonine protein kinase